MNRKASDFKVLGEGDPEWKKTRRVSGRRAFLAGAGALGIQIFAERSGAQSAEGVSDGLAPTVEPWEAHPGLPLRELGLPSTFEAAPRRTLFRPYGDLAPGAGASFTPLETLRGVVTPNALHFERSHAGIPEIDPGRHRLIIHGLVGRPTVFSVNALREYPLVSRLCFLECSGNSFFNTFAEPKQVSCGAIHGLVSCAEWTGVALSTLLEEAGVDLGRARWIIGEGADGAHMNRSIPIEKAMDDALVALYQNGEPLRPEQGYPVRLLLPGFEGNMSVKWLRSLKATEVPYQTREETSKYTDLLPDGRALQFTFEMGVKSVITHPSGGMTLARRGMHVISGLAWSGAGRIVKVEISTDGGVQWVPAALQEPVLPRSVTRFQLPWRWSGAESRLESRATDEHGRVQPAHAIWRGQYAKANTYHNNAIQTWLVRSDGTVANTYA